MRARAARILSIVTAAVSDEIVCGFEVMPTNSRAKIFYTNACPRNSRPLKEILQKSLTVFGAGAILRSPLPVSNRNAKSRRCSRQERSMSESELNENLRWHFERRCASGAVHRDDRRTGKRAYADPRAEAARRWHALPESLHSPRRRDRQSVRAWNLFHVV